MLYKGYTSFTYTCKWIRSDQIQVFTYIFTYVIYISCMYMYVHVYIIYVYDTKDV